MIRHNNNENDKENHHVGQQQQQQPPPVVVVNEKILNHKKSLSYQIIYKKIMYLCILVFTIFIICLSSTTTTSSSSSKLLIYILFQYHEPSIRIFRSLLEMVLLFICTSFSIPIYCQYISSTITHELLFQSIYNNNNDDDNNNNNNDSCDNDAENADDDDEDGKMYSSSSHRKYDDHGMFQPVHDDDIIIITDDDPNEVQETATTTTTNKIAVADRAPVVVVVTSSSVLHSLSLHILSIACDLLLYICIAFIFYLLSAISSISSSSSSFDHNNSNNNNNNSSSIGIMIAKIAAPTFPLLLFLYCCIRCIQYYPYYKEFYSILLYTIYAPFYNVTFRDGMIGDILTSMVRPMQDIAFTICYICFGLRGYWSDHQQDYYNHNHYDISTSTSTSTTTTTLNYLPNLISNGSNITTSFGNAYVESADAYVPSMEKSWLVHTAILPACMISPLWWRFLQTIRQSYDTEQRWPYLGNSMKYFLAAQVAMLGVYHPYIRRSTGWICSFIFATLYQIYWDVFMDWGLLVRKRKTSFTWSLRTQRLYPWKSFYWMLLIINTVLRFCWTLSFVPFNYLSATGVLTNNFSSEAWANILVFTIASAEIIRRTLWGLLRVEWEAIKVKNEMSNGTNESDHEVEMTPMKVLDATDSWHEGPHEFTSRYKLPFTSDMSSMNKMQIFGELCLYATTFAVLGLIIAAHRGTL